MTKTDVFDLNGNNLSAILRDVVERQIHIRRAAAIAAGALRAAEELWLSVNARGGDDVAYAADMDVQDTIFRALTARDRELDEEVARAQASIRAAKPQR